MANKYIIDYLKENKDKFSLDVLKKKLIEAGYPEREIEEAMKIFQQPTSKIAKTERVLTNFWDFRHKKIYISRKEKFFDFVTGFLFKIILSFIMGIFRFSFYPVRYFLTPLYLMVIIYCFLIKRGYISWGIIFGSFFSLIFPLFRLIF
jgi:hypothetical protein